MRSKTTSICRALVTLLTVATVACGGIEQQDQLSASSLEQPIMSSPRKCKWEIVWSGYSYYPDADGENCHGRALTAAAAEGIASANVIEGQTYLTCSGFITSYEGPRDMNATCTCGARGMLWYQSQTCLQRPIQCTRPLSFDYNGPWPDTCPSCTDGIKNQDETDVDCGGSCSRCLDHKACQTGGDCISKNCSAGVCVPATCTDGIRNQDESDVDCGGGCAGCAVGDLCSGHDDCGSRFCYAGRCKSASPCDLACVRYTELCPGSFGACVNTCNGLSGLEQFYAIKCVGKATTCAQADVCGLSTTF